MKNIQDRIQKFDDERGWSGPSQIKDLLLNMNEEIGEFWTVIKWVDAPAQQRLIQENKAEVADFIGDMVFLILKIAHLCGVDAEQAINEVLVEYEKRFPADQTKGRHANTKAGGIDLRE